MGLRPRFCHLGLVPVLATGALLADQTKHQQSRQSGFSTWFSNTYNVYGEVGFKLIIDIGKKPLQLCVRGRGSQNFRTRGNISKLHRKGSKSLGQNKLTIFK
jgi:hypothetical protein